MLEGLYERSMRDGGDRAAVRVLFWAMLAIAAPSCGALFVPIDEVVRADGAVEPEEVVPVQAADDHWLRLDEDLRGRTLAAGQPLGTARYELETDRSRFEARRLQERLAAHETAGRASRLGQDDRDERVMLLAAELAERRERLEPRPFVAPRAGSVLSSRVPPGEYVWLKRGETIFEQFREDGLVLRAKVPPHKAAELSAGMPAALENERTGERFAGRVRRVFLADRAGEGVAVFVDVEGAGPPRWACGLPLVARIAVERKPLWALLREVFVR